MTAGGSYLPLAFELSTARLSLRLRQPHDAVWNLELLSEHEDGPRPTLAQMDPLSGPGTRRRYECWTSSGFRRDHLETDERGELIYLVRDA